MENRTIGLDLTPFDDPLPQNSGANVEEYTVQPCNILVQSTPLPSFDQDANQDTPSGTFSSGSLGDKALRKRESDKKYRAKLKQRKMELEDNAKRLDDKNQKLEQENSQLRAFVDSLNSEKLQLENEIEMLKERLLSHENTNEKVKNDLQNLELKCRKQDELIQSLTKQHQLQLENEKMKYEIALLGLKGNVAHASNSQQ